MSMRATSAALNAVELSATEVVVQPDDVVLAEVVTVLDLDEDEVLTPGVLDPVSDTLRHVDGGAGPDDVVDAIEADQAGAANHEPVFGASRVGLVADAAPGGYQDRLHLVVGSVDQDREAAPGPLFEIEEVHGDILPRMPDEPLHPDSAGPGKVEAMSPPAAERRFDAIVLTSTAC